MKSMWSQKLDLRLTMALFGECSTGSDRLEMIRVRIRHVPIFESVQAEEQQGNAFIHYRTADTPASTFLS